MGAPPSSDSRSAGSAGVRLILILAMTVVAGTLFFGGVLVWLRTIVFSQGRPSPSRVLQALSTHTRPS